MSDLTPDRGAILRILYRSLNRLSACFPAELYNEYKAELVTKQELIDTIIDGLAKFADFGQLDMTDKCVADYLEPEDYTRIWGWIEKHVCYRKAELYYKEGLTGDHDVPMLTSLIMTKAIAVMDKSLSTNDPQAIHQVLSIACRVMFDSEELRRQKRLQEEIAYAHEAQAIGDGYH